jgi:hypothetical protein
MKFHNANYLKLVLLVLVSSLLMGAQGPRGLNEQAYLELHEAGVDKYLGQYAPILSQDVGDGWTKHTFDPAAGNGPICIAGTQYSVFTRPGNPSRLLIFEQGGGACWQDFYNCNVLSEAQEPPTARVGIWDFDSKGNPFADYSIVYMPYCDGSVFSGDNDVFDPAFGAAIGVPEAVIRFHRGLRNQSAGMDVARAMFPDASRITVAGSSAGGVGVAGFAPFLARFVFGNQVHLTVFNDAGPITTNPDAMDDIQARADDWQFGQFYPASCSDCSEFGDNTAIVHWRLDNDNSIRVGGVQCALVVNGHGALNAAYPDRYKQFIVAGDTSHTALQTPLFYTQQADGVLLNEWTWDFLVPTPFWIDIVEPAVP